MSSLVAEGEINYDPFDFAIDDDPYPVWKRMRDEAPLYYNEKQNFYALSRWDDVVDGLVNWRNFRSGDGTTFQIINSGVTLPPGIILMEDPPLHDLHRGILSGVFTPRRMNAVEPLVREFCRRAIEPLEDVDSFDVIADLGAIVPMRTIGYLLGIPEEDQASIRATTDEAIALDSEEASVIDEDAFQAKSDLIGSYIDWRATHPSDDLMTQLLNAEITDETGERRKLTRTEVLIFTSTVVGAGNETATRLIGFATQLLADNPDQRRDLLENRELLESMVEETLRFEAPSPVQCRRVVEPVEYYGRTVPAGAVLALVNGSANRDGRHFTDPDTYNIRRNQGAHLSFGKGAHFCLGAALARMEVRVVMDELIKRWPDWEVDRAGASKAHTASVRGWATLPIRVR